MRALLRPLVIGLAALQIHVAGQEPIVPLADTTNIEWVLPGDFGDALARAKAEKRLLLIKGISFGVDVEGAGCATKGRW